jgi:hypothetical protein
MGVVGFHNGIKLFRYNQVRFHAHRFIAGHTRHTDIPPFLMELTIELDTMEQNVCIGLGGVCDAEVHGSVG